MKWGYLLIFITLVIIGAFSLKYNYLDSSSHVTGQITSNTANINLTFAGSSGFSFTDNNILFGSGYYNGTCTSNYSILNSNGSKVCWVNTSIFSEDYQEFINNGTSTLNISATIANLTDAEEFFCETSMGCNYTNNAEILLLSADGEVNSCGSATGVPQWVLTNSTNRSITLCNAFGYADNSDTLRVYAELHIPTDAKVGNRTFSIIYEAVAL